jgi:hypothetical protein
VRAYKVEYYYWEVIECLRRLVLGAAVSLLGFGTAFIGVFGLIFSFGFIYLNIEFEPYKDPSHSTLGIVLAFGHACFFLTGLLIRTNSFDESLDNVIGIILTVLFFLGLIFIFLGRYAHQLSSLKERCRSCLHKFCTRVFPPKKLSDDNEDHNEPMPQSMQDGEVGLSKQQKHQKKARKRRKKHRSHGSGGFNALTKLILELAEEHPKTNIEGTQSQKTLIPQINLDHVSSRTSRELVLSLRPPPHRHLLEKCLTSRARVFAFANKRREDQFLLSIRDANGLSPDISSGGQFDSTVEPLDQADANDDSADAPLWDQENGFPNLFEPSLVIGDYVYWRKPAAELPGGTLGRVEAVYMDDDIKVCFCPYGQDDVMLTFSSDGLVLLHGTDLNDIWARHKEVEDEAAMRLKMQRTLSSKYSFGDGFAAPDSVHNVTAAAEPLPHQMRELLRDEHEEEVAFQAEEKAFLKQFLMSIGCGPETGVLTCLEDLGVESMHDLRDPWVNAEEELAKLPAIGPKKAKLIIELAIGVVIRDFII